jgi:hypothetical protein
MPVHSECVLPAIGRAQIWKWVVVYVSLWLIAFLIVPSFFIEHFQILLPSIGAIGIFLCFSLWLRFHLQDSIFGEIGFIYLAFALAYTVFPAYGFLTLDYLSSGIGVPILETLKPYEGELGVQLWRHVLFIAAIGSGYLLFRARNIPKFTFKNSRDAGKPIIYLLFVSIAFSVIALWALSAPVDTYIDNYTKYEHLSWLGLRVVTICTAVKTGGTFVLLTILFRDYKRYRLCIWPFVVLRAGLEVLNSLGSRIDAFFILMASALLYHYLVKRITLKRGFVIAVAFGLVFSVIEAVRLVRQSELDPRALQDTVLQGRGMPAGELGAVFVPGFHLYAERANGTLPPVEWPVFFNDFISIIPLAGDTKWNPMYWYADNYFPGALVPPVTVGPIAMSALWGGETVLLLEGFINGILFAFLMRWFARDGGKWQVMAIYVFCYSTCIMCLKYSILWHLAPVVKIILPLVVMISILAKDSQRSMNCPRVASVA